MHCERGGSLEEKGSTILFTSVREGGRQAQNVVALPHILAEHLLACGNKLLSALKLLGGSIHLRVHAHTHTPLVIGRAVRSMEVCKHRERERRDLTTDGSAHTLERGPMSRLFRWPMAMAMR